MRAIARDGAGREAARPAGTTPATPAPANELEERFAKSLGAGDATSAVAIALEVEDLLREQASEVQRHEARRVLRFDIRDTPDGPAWTYQEPGAQG